MIDCVGSLQGGGGGGVAFAIGSVRPCDLMKVSLRTVQSIYLLTFE